MKHLLSAAALAAALTLAPAAQAAVLYNVSGTFTADVDGMDGPLGDEVFSWSFEFTTANFITSFANVAPSGCSITGSFYECSATQIVDPTGTSKSPTANFAYVGFNGDNVDETGGVTLDYYFAANAFSTYGTHLNVVPSADGSGNLFYSAGPATLTVTAAGAVPEPATWAMLIAGFGLTGAALRRRPRKEAIAV